MKNLQALENLKQSAKEQSNELNNTITEIHKQNSKDLLENLQNIHNKRSGDLKKSIELLNGKMEKKTEELEKKLIEIHKSKLRNIERMIEDKLERENTLKLILTAIITFILTVAIISGIVYLTINSQYMSDRGQMLYYYTKTIKEK